jgi:Tfp pilus assembly protein PilF
MWMDRLKKIGCVFFLACLFGCSALEGPRLHVQGTEALERGDYAQAREKLSQAAELVEHPRAASQVQNHLGLAYLGEGNPELASAAFQQAVELDCRNEEAQHNLDVVAQSLSSGTQGEKAGRGNGGELQ